MTITTQAIIHSDLISHGLCSVTAIFPNILSLCCDIKWASISPLKLMLFIMLRVEHWNKPNGWMSNVHLNFNHANYVGCAMLLMAFRAFKFSCGRTKNHKEKLESLMLGIQNDENIHPMHVRVPMIRITSNENYFHLSPFLPVPQTQTRNMNYSRNTIKRIFVLYLHITSKFHE